MFGERENVICVRVDRTELSDSRWFTGSGITRKVTLTVSDPVCTGEYGVFFTVTEASPEYARVLTETEILNTTDAGQTVTVISRLTDGDGVCALELSDTVQVPAGESFTSRMNGILERPALWSPDTPRLYTLSTWLRNADGETRLSDAFPVGIRTSPSIRIMAFS